MRLEIAKIVRFASLATGALDFIFPRVCHICGNSLGDGVRYLCPSCRQQLPRSLYHRLPNNPVEQRFAGHFKFEHATSHLLYSANSPLSQLIQDMKYRHFKGIGRELGEIIGKELYTTPILADIDMIVPIPMHFWKKAKRGYNQAEEIAKGIGNVTGISIGKVLIAKKPHRTQTSLTHDERLKNLGGVFKVKEGSNISDKHILLLDDVCTTGATITEAAQTILANSPSTRISILTLAATH